MFYSLATAIGAAMVVAIILGALVAFPVMLLWDWLMPALFGLGEITYLQAWGLYMLCAILFQSKATTS